MTVIEHFHPFGHPELHEDTTSAWCPCGAHEVFSHRDGDTRVMVMVHGWLPVIEPKAGYVDKFAMRGWVSDARDRFNAGLGLPLDDWFRNKSRGFTSWAWLNAEAGPEEEDEDEQSE